MTTYIPEQIREAMSRQGIKNLRQLALRMDYHPAPVHRLFSGKNGHTTLKTYKRISEVCEWSLEQFFSIAHGNDPEAVSNYLRSRLERLGISIRAFCRHISTTTTHGGGYCEYLNGQHLYERLNVYYQAKSALGITADALYESLIISGGLTDYVASEKLSSTERQLTQRLEIAA